MVGSAVEGRLIIIPFALITRRNTICMGYQSSLHQERGITRCSNELQHYNQAMQSDSQTEEGVSQKQARLCEYVLRASASTFSLLKVLMGEQNA